MLRTQKNENRCMKTLVSHIIELPKCCPVSNNPLPGSKITITYNPKLYIIEVFSLKRYIDTFIGGKGEIRSMEGMIQTITKDCACAVGVSVTIESELNIYPNQILKLTTTHHV